MCSVSLININDLIFHLRLTFFSAIFCLPFLPGWKWSVHLFSLSYLSFFHLNCSPSCSSNIKTLSSRAPPPPSLDGSSLARSASRFPRIWLMVVSRVAWRWRESLVAVLRCTSPFVSCYRLEAIRFNLNRCPTADYILNNWLRGRIWTESIRQESLCEFQQQTRTHKQRLHIFSSQY